ncbi:MFS transporter [Leptospira langatensis]|uniref:MFS transporter n=1 Tax=Leptospira langatensis TaxID=2484983 RepID=A0A5F1ZTA3_9LEPT|nr:MFS transporter [Leptospira langatensis]TGK02918.1 MFS transporter [Leptospira langatensis]TGL41673.1 MFS transporter [Leptospira langatensis]
MQVTKRAPLREIFGWCMFDFANSSYTTVIITVIYCRVFAEVIVPISSNPANPYEDGNFLFGLALCISYLFVVLTGPLFGAISDFSAKKKTFLFWSYISCIISTASLWLVSSPGLWELGFVLIIISNFFFASGENFASSFLPHLGPKEELGKISGYAWGIGYMGGLLSVFIVQTFVVPAMDAAHYESLRYVGPLTAVFFLLGGIPTFLLLKEYQPISQRPDEKGYLSIGFKQLVSTLRSVGYFRDLVIYLISLFFSMAALAIVIAFAFLYGNQEIKITPDQEKALFILLQFFAMIGAIFFGVVQDKIGAKKTFNITLIFWIFCLIGIYFVREITSFVNGLGADISVQWVFVILGTLAGSGVGSTQSASRAIVGIFAPESKSGEFFGLWGLSGKLAAAIGVFAIGILQKIFVLRNAFLVVAVFFFISLLINFFVNEKRGIEKAKEWEKSNGH